MSSDALYKIEFYIPESHLESVKSAMFAAGAGKWGDYECCAWQTLGRGQFRPLAGSDPFLGEQGELEVAAEYKVEMICRQAVIAEVIDALLQAHPYEEVAYSVLETVTP